jgi:hypothetical protein
VKKTKKLAIKKVTLRNVDEPTLDAVAGGLLLTNYVTCLKTCSGPLNEKLGGNVWGCADLMDCVI